MHGSHLGRVRLTCCVQQLDGQRDTKIYAIATLRLKSVYLRPISCNAFQSNRISRRAVHNGGAMTTRNMLRVVTPDTAHAMEVACSNVGTAVGLPVRAEFQEIEGGNLVLELQLGEEAEPSPHPSRLASVVDESVSHIEVLSSWKEVASAKPNPRRCPEVLGVGYEPLPQVAQRALDDDLPTAAWDRSDSSWHLAVPSVCNGKAIVGMSYRSGYSHRFTAHDAVALRTGLAS